MRITRFIGLLMVAALLAAAGCTHKDLCFDHSHVAELCVRFDWKKAPDAHPEGMTVYFYGSDGYVGHFDLQGREGGIVRLPVGTYDVIAYNNDCQATRASGVSAFGSHELFTSECSVLEPASQQGSSVPEGMSGERVVAASDMVWSALGRGISVSENAGSEMQEIILCPEQLVAVYTVEVRGIKGLERVDAISGSLSGLSASVALESGMLSAERVTIPFAIEKAAPDRVRGRFCVFGHSGDCSGGHRLLLYLWMSSGHKFVMGLDSERFDVASQIHGAENIREVHIVIDGLTIPQTIGEGSGFNPSIDDWIEVDVSLDI